MRKAITVAMFSGMAGLGVLFGAHANAETHICMGGYGDSQSAGISAVKAAQGDPCDVPIHWPATVGLPGEPANVQGSLNVGVPRAVEAYDAAPSGPVVLEGSSLGSIGVAQAGDYITRVRGGAAPDKPLTVVTNGNPYGDSGIANDPGIAGIGYDVIGQPFFGVPAEVPQQGVNRNNINDAWGNSSNQLPQTQIADIATVQWNHTLPDPNAPHDTYTSVDPISGQTVVNEVYGVGENPVSAAAAANGTPLDPVTDGFMDVTFPVNNPADPQPPLPPLGVEQMPTGQQAPAATGSIAP